MPTRGPIRVAPKAIIVRDGALLLVRCRDDAGPWYLLPGGGQEPGETLEAALRRECREELGCDVVLGPLLFVRDYIAAHHEFADGPHGQAHQVELMFACALAPGAEPGGGHAPDGGQTGVEWVALDALSDRRVYPSGIAAWLRTAGPGVPARYVGDVN